MHTLLSQESGYSGASHPGLNKNASYHRMVYEDRRTILNPETSFDLIRDISLQFRKSRQSRLVMRIIVQIDAESLDEYIQSVHALGGYISYFRDQTPTNTTMPFYYVTYSENSPKRDISSTISRSLVDINRKYIQEILDKVEKNPNYNLEKLEQFFDKGFSITGTILPEELVDLWTPFGWSENACRDLLHGEGDDFVLGVRNSYQELIACILYSHQSHELDNGKLINHGELTEATTIKEYRGNGIMGILATALHARALDRGIYNVYGEYRCKGTNSSHAIQSLKFGLESGVRFTSGDLLFNHVDVQDFPDPHNVGLSIQGYGDQAHQLKSFMLGSLNPDCITPEIKEAYLNSIF